MPSSQIGSMRPPVKQNFSSLCFFPLACLVGLRGQNRPLAHCSNCHCGLASVVNRNPLHIFTFLVYLVSTKKTKQNLVMCALFKIKGNIAKSVHESLAILYLEKILHSAAPVTSPYLFTFTYLLFFHRGTQGDMHRATRKPAICALTNSASARFLDRVPSSL